MQHSERRRREPGQVRVRSVALPAEHGGWGFISEPIVLGLLAAPTLAGVFLGVAGFAAFLTRQPLKLFLKDTLKGQRVPRTALAAKFVLLYGGAALMGLVAALLLAHAPHFLLPLAASLPLLGIQLLLETRGKGRSLVAELSGAGAAGALAASLGVLAGWAFQPALALWLALAVKAVTAVLYVRSRLRLERCQPTNSRGALAAHVVGTATLFAAFSGGYLPWTAPAAMLVLLGRAALGLSRWRKPRLAKHIGFQEIGYGLLFSVLIALGV